MQPGSHHRRLGAGAATLLAITVSTSALAAPRTVLLESFGSTECGPCQSVRSAVEALQLEFDFQLVAVEYHASGLLADSASAARSTYYGSPSEPSSLFDGTDLHSGGTSVLTDYRDRITAHLAADTPIVFNAAAVFTESARTGSLSVGIEIDVGRSVPDPGSYVLRALFVEDGVSACCGPGNTDTWNRVVRLALPERPLTIGTEGEVQFEQWQAPLDPAWTVTGLYAVVWLQRDSDRSVLAATRAADAGGLQPLPISGPDESRVTLLPARPNPLRRGEASLLFTLPQPTHAKVQVLNVRGRVVRVLTDGPRPAGIHNVRWDGTDYTGRWMSPGIYFVRLETYAGILVRKLELIH